MNKFLVVIDLQREFTKWGKGERVYKRAVNYIYNHKADYTYVYATAYQQVPSEFVNMHRKLNYTECETIMPLEFPYDRVYYHSGYSIKEYPNFSRGDQVDVVGFDTDACVLSACFDLFDLDCDLRILTKYIYSSGGEQMHQYGLSIMKRQFGKCVI